MLVGWATGMALSPAKEICFQSTILTSVLDAFRELHSGLALEKSVNEEVCAWLPVVLAFWHPAPLRCLLATTAVPTLLGSLNLRTTPDFTTGEKGAAPCQRSGTIAPYALPLCPNANTPRSAMSMIPPAALHADRGFWIAALGCGHVPPGLGLPHSCQSFQRRVLTLKSRLAANAQTPHLTLPACLNFPNCHASALPIRMAC